MLASLVLPRSGLSAVTLWPAALTRGALAPTNVPFELLPFQGGHTSLQRFRLRPGQRLFAVVTHSDDAKAGWVIVANSMKLAHDALPCASDGDVGFSVFHTVAGLLMTADMAGCEVVEEIEFSATAMLCGPAAPMRHGLTVLYEDFRCRGGVPSYYDGRRKFPGYGNSYDRRDGVTLDVVPFQAIVVNYPTPEIPADAPATEEP